VTRLASRRLSPVAAGLGLTLTSPIFYSWHGVLTQLAFDAGASVGTVLSGRFLVAAAVLWLLVSVIRPWRPDRRQVSAGLLLGVALSAHAWLFSTSLTRLDAGLVGLLLFTYPALVMLGAVGLRRERWSARRAFVLGTVTAGTALVLVGGLHSIDALGALLALGSAVAYTVYILTSAGQLERTDPLLFTTLVATGGAITFTVGGAAQTDVSLDVGASALLFTGVLGLVVVGGMSTFIAGISRLGPSRASIVSAVEPALTPVVGFAVFADRLGPAQVLGGALVIAGIVILEARGRPFELRSRLSWLPQRERRALARVTAATDVPAGTRLLREGAPAGEFFLIERGRASVKRDDRHVAELGAGDFFGELALLRGGPRTASVAAASDMRVRVIPRREFVHAMEKLPTLARSVSDAASERLHALSRPPASADGARLTAAGRQLQPSGRSRGTTALTRASCVKALGEVPELHTGAPALGPRRDGGWRATGRRGARGVLGARRVKITSTPAWA
jgi:drug/metabolite transporter (DMT)-like permease/CRP-like cAMP-binding protein